MEAASPQCRCLQCRQVRLLRPGFPGIRALQLSPDKKRLAMINVGDGGYELWTGTNEPLVLDRRWVVEAPHAMASPVYSPDGRRICVPLLGPMPGLHIVDQTCVPYRITRGHDLDPRWTRTGRRICFYRVDNGITLLLSAPAHTADEAAAA